MKVVAAHLDIINPDTQSYRIYRCLLRPDSIVQIQPQIHVNVWLGLVSKIVY